MRSSLAGTFGVAGLLVGAWLIYQWTLPEAETPALPVQEQDASDPPEEPPKATPARVERTVQADLPEVDGVEASTTPAEESFRANGWVFDESGSPMADARVVLRLAAERSAMPEAEESKVWKAVSAPDGTFALEEVLSGEGRLVVWLQGFKPHIESLNSSDLVDHRVVLLPETWAAGDRTMDGWVLFVSGAPVAEATVRFRAAGTQTDSAGRFRLDPAVPSSVTAPGLLLMRFAMDDDRDALLAYKDGWAAAVLPGMDRWLQREDREPVVLVLEHRVRQMTGVLLQPGGAPAVGWKMQLTDGQVVSKSPTGPILAEHLVSGRTDPVVTDEQGQFSFAGLRDSRNYVLRAWNETTLQTFTSEPLPASSRGVVLQLPARSSRALLDGTVVGRDGAPVGGVRVRLTMVVNAVDGSSWMHTGQKVRTGEDGRFEFQEVPYEELFLRFDGSSIESTRVDVGPDDPGRNLRVEVGRFGHFTFLVDETSSNLSLAVEDGTGERLKMGVPLGEGTSANTRTVDLQSMQPTELRVTDAASWLLLLEGESVVARLPLRIVPGECVTLGR